MSLLQFAVTFDSCCYLVLIISPELSIQEYMQTIQHHAEPERWNAVFSLNSYSENHIKEQILLRPSGLYSVLAALNISCVCLGKDLLHLQPFTTGPGSTLMFLNVTETLHFFPIRLDLCCPRCLSAGGCPSICIRNVSCTKKVNILHLWNRVFRQSYLNGLGKANIGVLDQKLKSQGFILL